MLVNLNIKSIFNSSAGVKQPPGESRVHITLTSRIKHAAADDIKSEHNGGHAAFAVTRTLMQFVPE